MNISLSKSYNTTTTKIYNKMFLDTHYFEKLFFFLVTFLGILKTNMFMRLKENL